MRPSWPARQLGGESQCGHGGLLSRRPAAACLFGWVGHQAAGGLLLQAPASADERDAVEVCHLVGPPGARRAAPDDDGLAAERPFHADTVLAPTAGGTLPVAGGTDALAERDA